MKKKNHETRKSTSISKSTSVGLSKTIFAKKKKKITRTKSKLGTTKPVKSVSRGKINKWGTTSSTTTIWPGLYEFPKDSWIIKIWKELLNWLR